MPDPAPSSVEPTLALPPPGDTQTLPPTSHAHVLTGPPTVPGFEIEGELGRGGMGVVYRARQTKLNRAVALKMVLAGGHAGPAERVRFLAEAEAIAAVQHPGIVQVYEFGTCGEQPYFALEFCPGGSLAAKLAGTPLPPQEAAQLVEKIARAVQAAHDAGIVHRDLKPDNVLFAADGSPKVTDFGLARKVEGDSGLTKTGAIMGTPSYMAPEQATGRKDVGPAADVWAVGAILYECLTGRPPFRAANALDTVLQVASDDPVPPRALVPNLPRDVETIAVKCLQKEPAKRYASAGALADDLRHFLDGEPIAARPVSWAEKTVKKIRRRPLQSALYFLTIFFATFAVGTLISSVRRSNAAREKAQEQAAALDREATAARQAQATADAERVKAQARLEKAVEAVERLLTRVGGEKWTRDPALAAERRAVFEDAVAFYESFKDEDAQDPLVRREAAKAYRRIGGLYVLIAEYAKAEAALTKARALAEGLVAEHPGDGTYLADVADTILFTGHVAASDGRYQVTGPRYKEAAALARRASAARPDDDEVGRTLVSCLVSYGYFDMIDGANAVVAFREAVAEADKLVARPAAPFASRALAAYAYIGAATAEVAAGDRKAWQALIERAITLHNRTIPDPSAPAHYRDLHETTGGVITLHLAEQLRNGREPEKAAERFREAAAVFDRLLVVYPKAFQYRMYKLRILLQEVRVLAQLKRADEFARRRAELFALEEAMMTDSPNAVFVRYMVASERTNALVERAKAGDVAGFDAAADELLRPRKGMPSLPGAKYNVACAYSLASTHGTPAEREARAAKAVAILTELLAGNFYRGQTNAAYVDRDTDLDPIRGREDFKVFRAKMPEPKK